MPSLARRHFERTLAAKQATNAAKSPAATLGSMNDRVATLMLGHRHALKQIQSVKAKIEAKRGFLPEYAAYVDGVLSSGAGVQDDALMTVMVWRLDAGDYEGALAIAAYALRHDLVMPPGFNRDTATAVVEEIADAALKETGAVPVETVQAALDLTDGHDMPDEVRAKARKALGLALKDTDLAAAIDHLKAALDLDPKCGVKTELNRLLKQAEN